jgi:ribonuclease P protein component
MLERKHRLTKNKYFQYIYRKGERVNSTNLYIVYAKTKSKENRFGIVVSNKIGKAVQRNLIKRRLRSIVQQRIGQISQSYNYIIIAKEGIEKLSFDELVKELFYCLKKGGFIEKNN